MTLDRYDKPSQVGRDRPISVVPAVAIRRSIRDGIFLSDQMKEAYSTSRYLSATAQPTSATATLSPTFLPTSAPSELILPVFTLSPFVEVPTVTASPTADLVLTSDSQSGAPSLPPSSGRSILSLPLL